jgi:FtsX-like permease family
VLVFQAELRRRWRSWLAIAVLIGVVGGFVLAAAAASRRTESAFPRFVGAHGFDVVVYANELKPSIAKLPGVASVTQLGTPYNGQPTCSCTRPINPSNFDVVSATGRVPFKLVSGHLPNPSAADQVLASFTLEQEYGVRLGTVIHVPFYASSQLSAINNASGPVPNPTGPTVAFVVVGFEANEYEFPSGTTPTYFLYTTSAFARTVLPQTPITNYFYFVHLRHGAADILRFESAAKSTLHLNGDAGEGYSNEDAQAAAIEASIHPQAVGWWVLAALGALIGLAVVGQALARQSIVESEDYPTMAALGADRRQLVTLSMARNLVVGFAGASGAVGIATALSPLAPLGEARTAETSTGVVFDPLVLPLGALATVVVVLVVGLWSAVRAARVRIADEAATDFRPSTVVARVATTGAPPSAVIGVRHALEPGRGAASVPVGTALVGTALAVLALCATAVFGASLSHLTTTPRLYGAPFQLNFQPGALNPALLSSLEHSSAITAVTEYAGGGDLTINKVVVGAIPATSLRGPLLFSTVDGAPPTGPGQIGLGATTMRVVGAHLGSAVHVMVRNRTTTFRVVSEISFPVIAGGVVSLGTGALFSITGLFDAFCPPGPGRAGCVQMVREHSNAGILASVVPGPRGQAVINHYVDVNSSATLRVTPTSLVNFGEAVDFPLIFGVMLAVFGAATLAHLLVVSVARRRREIGLLKVFGFVNSQVVMAVAWQATTVALVGIVAGVPLGVVMGRVVWEAFAHNLGAVPVSVVPVLVVGGLAASVLIAANLIAVAPALMARRSKPGDLMREP